MRKIDTIVSLTPGAIISFEKPCDQLLDLEVGDHRIAQGEAVKVGETVNVKVLGFNKRKRRIDLSIKQLIVQDGDESAEENFEEFLDDDSMEMPTAMEIALRRAMGKGSKASKGQRRMSTVKGGRRRRDRLRRQQEDILSRTLQAETDIE